MEIQTIFSILDRYGIAVALLIVCVISARQFAIWLATKLIEPGFRRHIEFMDATQATQQIQAEASRQTASTLSALQQQQEANTGKITDIHTVILKLNLGSQTPPPANRIQT